VSSIRRPRTQWPVLALAVAFALVVACAGWCARFLILVLLSSWSMAFGLLGCVVVIGGMAYGLHRLAAKFR